MPASLEDTRFEASWAIGDLVGGEVGQYHEGTAVANESPAQVQAMGKPTPGRWALI